MGTSYAWVYPVRQCDYVVVYSSSSFHSKKYMEDIFESLIFYVINVIRVLMEANPETPIFFPLKIP